MGQIDQLVLMAGGSLRDKFQPLSFCTPLAHEETYFTYMVFLGKNFVGSTRLPRIGNNSASQFFSIQVGPDVLLDIL